MVTRAHRAAARPLFLRHQDRLAARPGARARAPRAERGELAFGTVDTLPALAADRRRASTRPTPPTPRAPCSTTSIDGAWDDELLRLFRVPAAHAAGGAGQRRRCSARRTPELFGAAIPIRGIAGDQQAALIGQACFAPGMVKATYGTGAFVLLNTGDDARCARATAC